MRENYFYKKILLGSFVFFFVLFCANTVKAQETATLGLSVNPQIFEMDVFPGETIDRRITVGNLSDVVMPAAVRIVNFTAAEYSGEMLFEEILQDPAVASRKWFKIEPANFILDINERRTINFSISVPEDAVPGGHYSVILFEPQLPSYYFKPGQPQTIPVVGVLFLLSVRTLALEPEVGQKLEVVEFSVPKEERLVTLENFALKLIGSVAQAAQITITEKSPQNFILRIKNNDIYHIKPYGKVLIYNWFGKKVGETEIPQRTILPGKIRSFPVEFTPEIPEKLKWLPASISNFLVQNFFVGRYQAKLEIQAKSPLTAEILKPSATGLLTFFSFPWQFWLPFTLFLALLLVFVVKYRKRIKLAIKILTQVKN